MIEDNKRVFITGAAGTGKSLLAREVALRQAEKGDKVLVLWFTNALQGWFEKEICHPRVTCAPIRYFAAGLLNEKGPDRLHHEPSEYWESVSERAACEGLPIRDDLWDFVIIDEGQDFSEEDWLLAFECSQKSDRLWVFADERQAFWQDRRMPGDLEEDFFHCQLQKPYRCAPAIQHLTDWQLKKRCEKILYCRQYCDLIPKRRDRR